MLSTAAQSASLTFPMFGGMSSGSMSQESLAIRSRLVAAKTPSDVRRVVAGLLDDTEWCKSWLSAPVSRRVLESSAAGVHPSSMPFDVELSTDEVFANAGAVIAWCARVILETMSTAPALLASDYTSASIPRAVRRAFYDRDIACVHYVLARQAATEDWAVGVETIRLLYSGFVSGMGRWFSLCKHFTSLAIPPELLDEVEWTSVFAEHERLIARKQSLKEEFTVSEKEALLVVPAEG